MRRKIIVLFLLLTNSINYAASEVTTSVEESEVRETSEVELESEGNELEVSSDVLSEEIFKEEESDALNEEESEIEDVNDFETEINSRTLTKKVIENYNGNKGETLTQYFENRVKTSAYLTDASGKRIRSWSYHSNGKVKVSYYWNGTIRLRAIQYDINGIKTTTFKYHSNNVAKEIVTYYPNGSQKQARTFDNSGYKLTHIEYSTNGKKTSSYTYYSGTNNVFRRQKFTNGILVETQERYNNGKNIKYLWTYQNQGKTVKQKIYYNTSGVRIKTEERWANFKLRYVWTYTSSGSVKTKEHYNANGIKQYTDTYNNGAVASRKSFEDYIIPLSNSYVTCGYGGYAGHRGLDLQSGSKNGNIQAAASGVVVKSGVDSGYGNHTVIYHGNGYYTLYAHMKNGSLTKKPGDFVVQGDKLGVEGETGNVTGIHLHFEVSKGLYSGNLEPEKFLPSMPKKLVC